MRKKILLILLSVSLLSLIGLTGCGGGSDEAENTATDEIRAAATGFMDALQAGDMETVKSYADPDLFGEDGDLSAFASIDNMSEEFAKAMGMDADALSETTKTEVQGFVDTLMKNLVSSYEITDVTEEEGIGKVTLTTTYGFDPDKMTDIDVNDEIEDMAEAYMEEHMDELMQAYNDDGESAMMSKLLDGLLGDVLKKYTDAVLETGGVSQESVMTLENKEGKWVVVGEKPVKSSDDDADQDTDDDADDD